MENIYIYYISRNGGVPSDYGMQELAKLAPNGSNGFVSAGSNYNNVDCFLNATRTELPYAIAIALDQNTPVMFSKKISSQTKHVDEIVQYIEKNRNSEKSTWTLCIEWLAKRGQKFRLKILDN